MRDGNPVHIKDELVEAIRHAEKAHLEQVESFYTAGDKVIINKGMYKDIKAIFKKNDGLERAVLMLNLLQKDVELNIETRHIRKA